MLKILLLLIPCIFSITASAVRCEEAYSTSTYSFFVMDRYIEIEDHWLKLNLENQQSKRSKYRKEEISELLSQFRFLLEEGIQKVLDGHLHYPITAFANISDTFTALKKRIANPRSQRVSNSLEDFIDSLLEIQPDFDYSFKSHDGENKFVSFSQNVVKDIFHSTDPLHQLAGQGFLRSLISDISGKNIKQLRGHPDIFEIRAIGKAGQFRLFGYYKNGSFQGVRYSSDSNHTSRRFTQTIKNVEALKTQE